LSGYEKEKGPCGPGGILLPRRARVQIRLQYRLEKTGVKQFVALCCAGTAAARQQAPMNDKRRTMNEERRLGESEWTEQRIMFRYDTDGVFPRLSQPAVSRLRPVSSAG